MAVMALPDMVFMSGFWTDHDGPRWSLDSFHGGYSGHHIEFSWCSKGASAPRTSHPVASPFEKTAHLSLGSVTSNLSIVSTVPLLFIPYNLTALHSTSRPFEASNKPPKHPKNSAESMFDLLGSQMSSPTCQEGLASFGQSFQTHGWLKVAMRNNRD